MDSSILKPPIYFVPLRSKKQRPRKHLRVNYKEMVENALALEDFFLSLLNGGHCKRSTSFSCFWGMKKPQVLVLGCNISGAGAPQRAANLGGARQVPQVGDHWQTERPVAGQINLLVGSWGNCCGGKNPLKFEFCLSTLYLFFGLFGVSFSGRKNGDDATKQKWLGALAHEFQDLMRS